MISKNNNSLIKMLSLNGKSLNVFKEDYVNVSTNRRITNLDNPNFKYMIINSSRICGIDSDIDAFMKLNKISNNSQASTPMRKNVAKSPESPGRSSGQSKETSKITVLKIPSSFQGTGQSKKSEEINSQESQ